MFSCHGFILLKIPRFIAKIFLNNLTDTENLLDRQIFPHDERKQLIEYLIYVKALRWDDLNSASC